MCRQADGEHGAKPRHRQRPVRHEHSRTGKWQVNVFKSLGLGLKAILVAAILLAYAAACGSDPVEPTPTPEPELSMEDLLASAGEKLAAITTAKFRMSDETQSGTKFFGATLKTVEGDIRSPEAARMVVDVEAPAMGFVQIEIVAVGEQAFMKFSRDAPWLPIPLDQVPFNFGGIGVILSEILPVMQDPAITGRESIGDFQTIRIEGNVLSEDMSGLISSVDPGHPIILTYWFDDVEHTIRQLRIDGQLFDDDAPETTRLVNMEINVPVDIQLPEVAPGP